MQVLNAKDGRPSDGVYIGRPSILSNPFIINRDGDRDEVIMKFKDYFIEKFLFDDQYRKDALDSVMSKSTLIDNIKLICHCKPNKCHGDVVKEVIEDYLTMDYNKFFIKYAVNHYSDYKDGKFYVNIYSRGITKLGRYLSNMSNLGFEHPEYGTFSSMEGFWYYIKTGKKFDNLKTLQGFKAKEFGKSLSRIENSDFKKDLMSGLECKILQNSYLLELVLGNELPYVHYYVYGHPGNDKVFVPKDDGYLESVIEVTKKIKSMK